MQQFVVKRKRTMSKLVITLIILTGITQTAVARVINCNDTRSYIIDAKNGYVRTTTRKDGNYIIHFLLELSNNEQCDVINRMMMQQLLSAKYVIDSINDDSMLLPWVTLGYQMDDSCISLPITMSRAIEVVSLHRPNSVCRAPDLHCSSESNPNPLVKASLAVVGARRSFLTIPVASLMSLYRIPQISPSASSRLLEKRDMYGSFFRTISSDTVQVQVMLDIIDYFGWNYIFAVGSDDDYGKMGIAELKTGSIQRNVCIVQDEYVPFHSKYTQAKVIDIVNKIRETPEAKVVVLFGYTHDQGELILQEAEKQNIQRFWLTSEAWNPEALEMNVTKRQLIGVLTVSLVHIEPPDMTEYAVRMIPERYSCEPWVRSYVRETTSCDADKIEDGHFVGVSCQNGKCSDCRVNLKSLMEDLFKPPGSRTTQNLLDAVFALAHAMHDVIVKSCGKDVRRCSPDKIVTAAKLTEAMYNVSFMNEHGNRIAFDKNGNPAEVRYMIENIQEINGKPEYVAVGYWNSREGLKLDNAGIQWPYWSEKRAPASVCSEQCPPGMYYEGKTGCCWKCTRCAKGYFSNKTMSSSCSKCPAGYHTVDNKICTFTPIRFLQSSDTLGAIIITVSGIGLLLTLASAVVLFRTVGKHPKASFESIHKLVMALLILIGGFAHAFAKIIKPTDASCQAQVAYFFILATLFSSYFLVSTLFINSYLASYPFTLIPGGLPCTQMLFVISVTIIEAVSLIVWFTIEPIQVSRYEPADENEIWLECKPIYNVPRLISTIIPCIVLVSATFYSFRERNNAISAIETKFLSFACIAFCIIMAVFLPTYKYVVGVFRAVVSAFTIDICTFTFLACILLPKVYVALLHSKHSDEVKSDGRGSLDTPRATETTDGYGNSVEEAANAATIEVDETVMNGHLQSGESSKRRSMPRSPSQEIIKKKDRRRNLSRQFTI